MAYISRNTFSIAGSSLYTYGGWDGQSAYNTLSYLDLVTMTWAELKATNPSEAAMRMSGCGMVAYGTNMLVLFGGYGVPSENQQPGSTFFRRSGVNDEKGWTNELRVFNIEDGT